MCGVLWLPRWQEQRLPSTAHYQALRQAASRYWKCRGRSGCVVPAGTCDERSRDSAQIVGWRVASTRCPFRPVEAAQYYRVADLTDEDDVGARGLTPRGARL